jgi:hypothetical protein
MLYHTDPKKLILSFFRQFYKPRKLDSVEWDAGKNQNQTIVTHQDGK